ncbi:unnamed protein product [Microthlaspi erraticum]|uniref:Retrovirus-related Pol polyprotein from transposon TNT 1-94-like beta-barrel domain-containing protein n=1 Tax=Microthlaspi erraticum TaxID=1685480 RepID=A0A6D2HN20_9BRAS|nr:unnamed protein product [Microthlaspi erraticum]
MALFEESNEVDNTGTWYFDSGCSRHMTGMKENLQDVKQLKGGKCQPTCDEGLTVWFNKLECKAIDADGKQFYEEFVQATTATCGINLQNA